MGAASHPAGPERQRCTDDVGHSLPAVPARRLKVPTPSRPPHCLVTLAGCLLHAPPAELWKVRGSPPACLLGLHRAGRHSRRAALPHTGVGVGVGVCEAAPAQTCTSAAAAIFADAAKDPQGLAETRSVQGSQQSTKWLPHDGGKARPRTRRRGEQGLHPSALHVHSKATK